MYVCMAIKLCNQEFFMVINSRLIGGLWVSKLFIHKEALILFQKWGTHLTFIVHFVGKNLPSQNIAHELEDNFYFLVKKSVSYPWRETGNNYFHHSILLFTIMMNKLELRNNFFSTSFPRGNPSKR